MMWAMCVKKLHDKTLYYSNKKSATIVCNCDSMSEKKTNGLSQGQKYITKSELI